MEKIHVIIEKLGKPVVMAVSFLLFVITAVLVNFVFKTGIQYLTQTLNYSPDIAYQMISDYGEAGRASHLTVLIADVIMVILYTLFLTTTINKTFGKVIRSDKLLTVLCITPLLLAVMQLTEVVGVYAMLTHYPKRLDGLAKVIGIVTSLKFYLTYICFALPAAGFIISKIIKPRPAEKMLVK